MFFLRIVRLKNDVILIKEVCSYSEGLGTILENPSLLVSEFILTYEHGVLYLHAMMNFIYSYFAGWRPKYLLTIDSFKNYLQRL